MEYNSFYGGRRGASFIIVKTYPDIPTMCRDFAEGGDFTTVGYDEYVLINTYNKNHPDNGKIFRRGYDYNSERIISCYRAYKNDDTNKEIINGNETDYLNCHYKYDNVAAGGAEYIGTIAGPAGRSPLIELTNYQNAAIKQAQEGFEQRKSFGEYKPNDLAIVPGKTTDKDGNAVYNDTIKWYCTSIRNANDEDSTAYIGFTLPYPVVQFQAETVDPYYNRSNETGNFFNTDLITRNDEDTVNGTTNHPFYEHWDIKIPKGIKGDTLKHFRVMIPQESNKIYSVGTFDIYPGFRDDIAGQRAIFVYDYYHYDKEEGGEPVTYYIGDYNVISSFIIDQDGSVHVRYTHKTEGEDYPYLIRWITNFQFNVNRDGSENTGHVIITYNTKRTDGKTQDFDEYDLDWIEGMSFDADGTVHYKHTTRTDDDKQEKLVNWITGMKLVNDQTMLGVTNSEEGKFTINFNNDNLYKGQFVTYLKWMNGLTIEDNGEVTLHFSGHGDDVRINEDNPIKWIKKITLDTTQGGANEGGLVVTYNTDLGQEGTNDTYRTSLKWVNNITLSDDGQLTLSYSGGGQDKTITSASKHLRWVKSITLAADGTLTVNYNDGTKDTFNKTLKWITSTGLAADGTFTINYNNGSKADTYSKMIKWVTGMTVGTDGTITINYNNGDQATVYSKMVKWIDSVSTTDDGSVKVTYNNGTSTDLYTKKVKWIKNITLADDGTLTISFNNGDPNVVFNKKVKWITKVALDDQDRIVVSYNDGTSTIVSDPINFIDDMVLGVASVSSNGSTVSEKNHLLVKYSAPSKRGSITYNGTSGWTDLGYIFDGVDISGLVETELKKNVYMPAETTTFDWTGAGVLTGTQGAGVFKTTMSPSKIVKGYSKVEVESGTITLLQSGESFGAYDKALQLNQTGYILGAAAAGVSIKGNTQNLNSVTPIVFEITDFGINVTVNIIKFTNEPKYDSPAVVVFKDLKLKFS